MFLTIAACLALARDLEFERVEVEWQAESGIVKNLSEVLPEWQASLIRLLGDDRYAVKRLAEEELARMGRDASLALAWGMRAKDKDIAEASGRIRGRLYRCRHCYTGACLACVGDQPIQNAFTGEEVVVPCPEKCNWRHECVACDGLVDLRLCVIPVEWEDEVVLRSLFAK